MSLCYLPLISHDWHSSQQLSEPLSPRTTVYGRGNTASSKHGLGTLSVSSLFQGFSEGITWPSESSCQGSQETSSEIPTSNQRMDSQGGPSFSADAPERIVGGRQRGIEGQKPSLQECMTQKELVIPSEMQGRPAAQDDDDNMAPSDLEDIAEDGSLPQTALNRRAEKRKTKRFRYGPRARYYRLMLRIAA